MSIILGVRSPHYLGIWSTSEWRWRPSSWPAWEPAWCCDTWCSVPARNIDRILIRNRSSSRCRMRQRPFADRSCRNAGPDIPDTCADSRSQACRCHRRRHLTISTSPDRIPPSASLLRKFAIYNGPINPDRLSCDHPVSFKIAASSDHFFFSDREKNLNKERGEVIDIFITRDCVDIN